MKKIVMFLCLSFSVHLLMAQVPDSLKLRLVGKAKLSDIMREVEDYYKNDKSAKRIGNNGEVEFENDYLHWKRWEYYQGSRLDEQGKIIPDVNAKIFEEFKKYQSLQKNTKSPQSSYSGWNAFGPTTVTRYGAGYNSGYGRVNCIAFHPSNANYLLIGTPQGGIWKSFNNGTSWFSLTDNLPSNGIGGLVWDRTNVNVIYALTGDADASGSGFVSSYGYNIPSLGVFKSTDGGTTWGTTGPFPNVTGNFYGYKLIQHPTNANILFAATTAGIFETTDGGDTWVRQVIGNFTDIEFKPGNPTIMYAAQLSSTSPFWRSTNSGDTWTNSGFTNVPFNSNRIAIGVSNNQPNYIYLLAGPSTGSGMYVGLFRSTGAFTPSFSLRSNTPNILGYPNDGSDNQHQAGYDLAIEVDPNHADTILTGGINIWKSTDGGSSFGTTSKTQWTNDVLTVDYVHADIHNLAYNPYNGYLYCTSDGGVGYSTDNGSNWTFISDNLQILDTYHSDWYEANADILASGTQDNGTNIRYTASNTYRHIYGADGFDCAIKDNDPNTIVFVANNSLNKTTNGGTTSTNVSPVTLEFFPLLARDYITNTRLFAGDGDTLYRSTDFGSTWSSFGNMFSGRVLTTCPSNSDRLYTSNGSILQRSDNATTTMTFTSLSGTAGYPQGVFVTDLEVRPSNSLYAYACFGGYSSGKKVYFTTDGGTPGGSGWTNFSGSLPNVACHSIAVDANNTVYVGTDIGVFVRSATMTDWQPFYNNLPCTPVSDLMVNNTAGRIIASTFGRGNFYTDLYSSCFTTLTISGPVNGAMFYEASGTITSTSIASQGAGNTLALKAGDYVQLNPGFEIKNNSEWRAYIAPCNTGGIPLMVSSFDQPLPTETMYVPAKNGVRYADGKISSILPDKSGALMEIITEGIYSLRIVDHSGAVVKKIFTDVLMQKKTETIYFQKENLNKGLYYLQLFKENELVHFHELELK